MKILVLSDSHGSLDFMRDCIRRLKPDTVVHLGDYFEDGRTIAEENPHLVFHQVPGNCDRYRCPPWQQEILVYPVCGVKLYMTHGHKHGVKFDTESLLWDARKCGVEAVLYGHTHQADCHREPDGLWVLNPGSCGRIWPSAGIILTENGHITTCQIIRQTDLEEMA